MNGDHRFWITDSELIYYFERLKPAMILTRIAQKIKYATNKPYQLLLFDRSSQKDDEERQDSINKALQVMSNIGFTFCLRNSERIGENIPVIGHDSYQGITKSVYNRIDPLKALDPSQLLPTNEAITLCEVLECNEVAEITCCEGNFFIDQQVISVCNRAVCKRYHGDHNSHRHQFFKPLQMTNKTSIQSQNFDTDLSSNRRASTGTATGTSKNIVNKRKSSAQPQPNTSCQQLRQTPKKSKNCDLLEESITSSSTRGSLNQSSQLLIANIATESETNLVSKITDGNLRSEMVDSILENKNECLEITSMNVTEKENLNASNDNKKLASNALSNDDGISCLNECKNLTKREKGLIDRGRRSFIAVINREWKSKISNEELAVLVDIELNHACYGSFYKAIATSLGISLTEYFNSLLKEDTKKGFNRKKIIDELFGLYIKQIKIRKVTLFKLTVWQSI
jgi:hypothetical protein